MKKLILYFLLIGILNAESKIALLIGNSNYDKKSLTNPTNDVDLLESKLTEIGFTVIKRKDLSKSKMISELKDFYNQMNKNTIALIYFSGHGVNSTLDGKNYLIPIGAFSALFNEGQLPDLAISDNYLLNSTLGSKFSILLLDACRSNDFAKTRGDNGLGQPQSRLENDYIISYATAAGKTAEDGIHNSPYALALSRNLTKNQSIAQLFTNVRKEVSDSTHGKQKPLYLPAFNEMFYLNGKDEAKVTIKEKIIYRDRVEKNKPIIAQPIKVTISPTSQPSKQNNYAETLINNKNLTVEELQKNCDNGNMQSCGELGIRFLINGNN